MDGSKMGNKGDDVSDGRKPAADEYAKKAAIVTIAGVVMKVVW